MIDAVKALERWYIAQCDGAWEHQFGVTIATLDNPGWKIVIAIAGTSLAERRFEKLQIDRSELDWLRCRIEGEHFKGWCGPENLQEMLNVFLSWANEEPTT